MSPHVGNFVADLVEMAKATETLPIVQAELDAAKREIESMRHHVQGLELNIAGYKADIEGLNARNHKLEAERDDAELRFLECEEKLASLTASVRFMAQAVGMVDKPEPAVVTHEPMPMEGWSHTDQSDPLPTVAQATDAGLQTFASHLDSAEQFGNVNTAEAPAVANPPDPTAPSTAGDGHLSADAQSVSAGESVSTNEGRFVGVIYSRIPQYVPLRLWLEGGGTEDNYYR